MKNSTKISSNYFFYKSVLRKVSFSAVLFEKELNKALISLSEREKLILYRWALTFARMHPELHPNLLYAS